MLKIISIIAMLSSASAFASRNYYSVHFAEVDQASILPEICDSRAFPQAHSTFAACSPLDFTLEVLNMELPGLLRRATLNSLHRLLLSQSEHVVVFIKNESHDFLILIGNRLFKINNRKDEPVIQGIPASAEELELIEAQVERAAFRP